MVTLQQPSAPCKCDPGVRSRHYMMILSTRSDPGTATFCSLSPGGDDCLLGDPCGDDPPSSAELCGDDHKHGEARFAPP
ncbi:hypothetical protein E2562_021758 [Oryza meyeriana var. granulata]|uniref:Uncharacterized protein n=1 Tax=Oryza meyeriana var. granulata TaxID=110450 RepID=A0A6G1EXZ0_9ORYZ|nr:hypothetical protein E2562_021758 [Oryza meyeriana var. granulata]